MQAVLSIDQSTAGTKGLVWSLNGDLLARSDVPHRQIGSGNGWLSHDPMEIYENCLKAAALALEKSGAQRSDILCAGISNQRETAVCWSRKTGKPLADAIVWQCSRAKDIEKEVRQAGLADYVYKTSGLPLSPYFSGAKYGWLIKNVPEVKDALDKDDLCCGTIDSWLVYKLCGEFKTDYSNASRTQLLNLDTLQWDDVLVEAFGLKKSCLGEICFSDSLFGKSDFNGLFPKGLAVHGVLGDSHGALFANLCWQPNTAKVTYGTGSSVMMNAGAARPAAEGGIAASLAWGMNKKVEYVLEGNINYTGAVTKWLADSLGLIGKPSEAGQIAKSAPGNGGVYLVPAFSGLGAPHYNNSARGAFLGMDTGTKKEHLVRAAEECIAYQICDVVEAINKCGGFALERLAADGGPTNDEFLMQFQADMLQIPLGISQTEELSGKGAALCAAIALGLTDREQMEQQHKSRIIMPQMDVAERNVLYSGWKNAVNIINRSE